MAELIEKAAVLRIIFDNVGKPATEIYQKVRELPPAEAERPCWIPVTERLPEKNCQVLAHYGFDHGDGYLGMTFMQVLDYYETDPRPHFQHEGLNGMRVSHWLPLPEPPKEEV